MRLVSKSAGTIAVLAIGLLFLLLLYQYILDPGTLRLVTTLSFVQQRPLEKADGVKAACMSPELVFHSQSGEDRAVFDRYFAEPLVCSGTFVEIGALNGVLFSNTKFFEDQLGWTGVLIEAEPRNAKRLMINRPHTKNFAMAVCPEGQKEVSFITFIGRKAVGGIVDQMTERHRKRWIKENTTVINVPCKPMSAILREAQVTKIDLFSLDVEGGELLVLQTMDWSIPVRVFVIEMGHGARDEQMVQLLGEHGYRKADWNIMDHCPVNRSCMKNAVFENNHYNIA